MTAHVVTCYECDPPDTMDAVLIFAHWRDVHDLHFEISEAPPEHIDALAVAHEEGLRVYEVEADRLEEKIMRLPWPIRWWRLRQMRGIRREIARLREEQIEALLRAPYNT